MRSGFSSFSFLFLWNATGFLFLEMGSHEPKKIVFPFSLWIYIYTHICIEDPNHSIGFKSTKSIFCFLDVFDNSSSRCRRPPPVAGSIFVFPGFSKFISLSLSLMLYHPVLSLVQLKDGKLMATFNPRQLNVIWGGDHLRYWKMPAKWGSFCLFFELFLFLIRVELWFWKESMLVSLI